MRVADLLTGPARLDDAIKTLRLRYEETRLQWRDPVSLEFEKNYLEPLEQSVQGALERMRALAASMSAAEQHCGE